MGRVHAQKLFAYWLTSVGSLAMQYSFSIIFVDLLVAFDSTRAATAAVGSLCAGLMDGFGVVSGRAIARRGEVACGSLGALLSGLGLIASSQCTTLWQLYVTYGVSWALRGNQPVCRQRLFSAMFLGDDVAAGSSSGGTDIATPSSRCRVDGVEVDAAIQDERAVNLISTQVGRRPVTGLYSGVIACNSGSPRTRRSRRGYNPARAWALRDSVLWAALKRNKHGAGRRRSGPWSSRCSCGALGLAPPPPSSEKRARLSIAVSAVPGCGGSCARRLFSGSASGFPRSAARRCSAGRGDNRRAPARSTSGPLARPLGGGGSPVYWAPRLTMPCPRRARGQMSRAVTRDVPRAAVALARGLGARLRGARRLSFLCGSCIGPAVALGDARRRRAEVDPDALAGPRASSARSWV